MPFLRSLCGLSTSAREMSGLASPTGARSLRPAGAWFSLLGLPLSLMTTPLLSPTYVRVCHPPPRRRLPLVLNCPAVNGQRQVVTSRLVRAIQGNLASDDS